MSSHKPEIIQELTPELREVLQVLVKSDVFWRKRNKLLEVYGLPYMREDIRRMLDNTLFG